MFTSVHSNLEYGLAILTESFSPLRSVLHNLSCWSPNQKWHYKPCYSWYCLLAIHAELVLTGLIRFQPLLLPKSPLFYELTLMWYLAAKLNVKVSSGTRYSHNYWNLSKSLCFVCPCHIHIWPPASDPLQ